MKHSTGNGNATHSGFWPLKSQMMWNSKRKATILTGVFIVGTAIVFILSTRVIDINSFRGYNVFFSINQTHTISDNISAVFRVTARDKDTELLTTPKTWNDSSANPNPNISIPSQVTSHPDQALPGLGSVTSHPAVPESPQAPNALLSPATTKVTFDPNIIVSCKESPFIDCHPLSPKPAFRDDTNRTYRIAFLRRPPWFPSSAMDFSRCPFKNCVFDESTVTEETDMVLVYGVGLNSGYLPPRRWPHQIYAVGTWESPLHTHADFLSNRQSIWNNAFNATMSYRADSDVFAPYFWLHFKPAPLEQRPNYYEIAKQKTKTAIWAVSNCKTPSRRDEYVLEMQNYIDVDIYGGCGIPCSRSEETCMKQMPTVYKFYLSFENSICTDYISEKFFKLYRPGMYVIPVVRGGADYEKYFDNNTFINAANFKNATDLALHLKNLASDLVTYSKYLEYIDMYKQSETDMTYASCRLCEYTSEQRRNPVAKTYDMKAWMGDGHCRTPHDIG